MDKYSNDSETVRKESVVEREISGLSKATDEMYALSNELESKLSSVLRQQPEGSSEGKPEEALTALPSAIREQRSKVFQSVGLLKSIISRLEL